MTAGDIGWRVSELLLEPPAPLTAPESGLPDQP